MVSLIPRIFYENRWEAEDDTQAYDEYYDFSQLRTEPEYDGEQYSVLFNAPWPRPAASSQGFISCT